MKSEIATSDKGMAVDIVSAFVGNNRVSVDKLPGLIEMVYKSLVDLGKESATGAQQAKEPAISVRRSVTRDYMVCLEDGKKFKMLRRHLRTTHEMTPDEYRAKWGLRGSYPMIAPGYATKRSKVAKKIGLGRASKRVGRPKRPRKISRGKRIKHAA